METHHCGLVSAVLERFEPYLQETGRFKIFSSGNPDLGQNKCELFHSSLPQRRVGTSLGGGGCSAIYKIVTYFVITLREVSSDLKWNVGTN
jgi:hypothetical protein